jgi:hypothetical protein
MNQIDVISKAKSKSLLVKKNDGAKLQSDSRPSFVFLPGDKSILIAIGNQLVQ